VIVNGVNKNIYKEMKKVIEMADKIIRVSYSRLRYMESVKSECVLQLFDNQNHSRRYG